MSQTILSVSEVNVYLKEIIEGDFFLDDVWVEGEISNLKYYAQGRQYYFTLSDSQAQLNCVIYGTFVSGLKFNLENGVTIAARGKMKFFHKKGSLSFQISYALLKGAGSQSKQFQLLKEKLYKEGLFDPSRKKPIPAYPRHVGIITSLNSAAMWDFVTVSRGFAPHLNITVIPAVMQGVDCPSSVQEAIELADKKNFDVLVLLRGGGAAEDLAGFNHEGLVRALATLETPLITALGHEVDYSLSDFVADLRKPTPSAAAEYLTKSFQSLRQFLERNLPRLSNIITRRYQLECHSIEPLLDQAEVILQERITQFKGRVSAYLHRVEMANPLHKLRQGYSMARLKSTGDIIKYCSQIQPGSVIQTQVLDGAFESKVNP